MQTAFLVAAVLLLAFVLLAGVAAVAAVVVMQRFKTTSPESEHYATKPKYRAKNTLLTANELHFLKTLEEAAGSMKTLACVRVADLLEPTAERYKKGSGWQRDFNAISSKHVDFVLCGNDMRPLLAIELDDSTHGRSERVKRDIFLDQAFRDAGFPLLRVKSAVSYNATVLRKEIASLIAPAQDAGAGRSQLGLTRPPRIPPRRRNPLDGGQK